MKKKMKKDLKKNEEGFTLIEIIIVVVIIGFLASTIGPNLFNRVSEAEIGTTKNQMEILELSLDNYRLDNGMYPSTEQGLDALIVEPTTYPMPRSWNGPYLEKKEIPLDSWGKEFKYKNPGTNNTHKYDLWSIGPDGKESGDSGDDITNW